MHHGAAHDPRQQLLRHLSAGFRFSVQRAHRWRGRQPRVRERRLRLAARIRCIEQHLGALSRQVRRSAANARSRQRHVPAAGLALPHVRYPVGELWHPGHRPDRPHALHLDRGAAKGQRLQGQRFYHRRALATTGRSRHRRHSGGDTPLLLHGRSATARRISEHRSPESPADAAAGGIAPGFDATGAPVRLSPAHRRRESEPARPAVLGTGGAESVTTDLRSPA